MEIKDKIKLIKESRMFPYKTFILNVFLGSEECKLEDYPNHIYYKRNNEILIDYDKETKRMWLHTKKVWNVYYGISKENGYNEKPRIELQQIIKEYLTCDDFNIYPSYQQKEKVWMELGEKLNK